MRLLLILIISFTLIDCKNNQGGKTTQGDTISASVKPVEEQCILSNQKAMSDSLVQSLRAAALPILENRLSATTIKSVTGLDKDLWHVEAILKGSDITFGDNLKGAWLDFGDDATYKYGHFDQVSGSGKYHYDVDKSTLIMVDNDNRIKPQEFQPMLTNDALVLVGSSIYKDNNMQAKFVRNTAMPVKPEPKPVY